MNLEGIQSWLEARAPEAVSPGALEPGMLVGGWRVAAYLGHGLSSEVYRVVNYANGGAAALKLLVNDTPDLRRRFINERKTLSSLSPHIPELPGFYATGEHDGRLYYVMELLEPVELPLPAKRIVPFVLTLARAVSRLHMAHYLHRDLKPANLMCRRHTGEPVLIDLGLVKSLCPLEHGSPLAPATQLFNSQTSIIDGQLVGVGTPGWAAPEQILEGKCSFASDIFALGKIARACFAKRPPHAWRVIIRQATHQEPSERHSSVDAFIMAIRHRNLPLQIATAIGITLLTVGIAVGHWLMPSRPTAIAVPPSPEVTPQVHSPSPAPEAVQLSPLPKEEDAAYIARLTALAQQNNADAQCLLAECYFHGRHVAKDLDLSTEWYLRAAVNGATGAMVTLGDIYLRGIGRPADPHIAIYWYREAMRRGHLGAQTNLGYCLLHGQGTDHNDAEAIRLITNAASRNYAEAQRILGECHLHGHGVPKDPAIAKSWIQRAAQQGNRRARKLLELL